MIIQWRAVVNIDTLERFSRQQHDRLVESTQLQFQRRLRDAVGLATRARLISIHAASGASSSSSSWRGRRRGRLRENEWAFRRDNRSIIDDFRSTKCSLWRVECATVRACFCTAGHASDVTHPRRRSQARSQRDAASHWKLWAPVPAPYEQTSLCFPVFSSVCLELATTNSSHQSVLKSRLKTFLFNQAFTEHWSDLPPAPLK